ncbi:hypothetical protein [Erythrobacter sp.]|uniref:hypothetical protein n=1 Tax=Erythrobacter sp. TaxID=1042 RepID=UPI002ECAA0E6|nr:hypothetical protein [Erythrobacter sp.]
MSGTPIGESQSALEDCLARGCAPEEDIALTLAHAENLFIAGDYKDGEEVLNDSLGRTRKFKSAIPVPLSDLHRARSRFAQHLGEPRDYRLAALDSRDVLKDAFGEDDRRVLIADIEVGDSRAKLGFPADARRIYRDVEEEALELGHTRVASFARLRLAMLAQAKLVDRPGSQTALADYEAALDRLIEEPLPESDDFIMVARVLKARAERERGEKGATDTLIETFAAMGGTEKPVLLYNEPLKAFDPGGFPIIREFGLLFSNEIERRTTPVLNNARFIDVGFWIRPNGEVEDIELLRAQGTDDWHGPVIQSIASRRYAPLNVDEPSPGVFHVERYTYTSNFAAASTGTRIRLREPGYRIQRLDLTPENTENLITTEG